MAEGLHAGQRGPERRPGRLQKLSHLSVVLFARLAFDARAGVHTPGVRQFDGARHIGSIQAASYDDRLGRLRRAAPIECLAGAAVQVAGRAIQQEGLGGSVAIDRETEVCRHARRFPYGDRLRIAVRGFLAMQLRHVQRRNARGLFHPRGRLVHKHAHAPHARRRFNAGGSFRREIARAARVEVEADGRGARIDGGGSIFLIGDAADFENGASGENHGATNFASAAAGSLDFMRCSPTRNAWYPAARKRAMSLAS